MNSRLYRRQRRQRGQLLFCSITSLLCLCLGFILWATYTRSHSNEPHISQARLALAQQRQLRQALQPLDFSGTAIIVRDNQLIASYSHGQATNHRCNQFNTAFEIDSLQKALTATLIMQLVAQHQLDLQENLQRFYPQIPDSQHITLRQLLDMTSGLVAQLPTKLTHWTSDQAFLTQQISQLHFVASLHGHWNYAPINYMLLSGIIEKITGRSYQQVLTQQIIQPLQLQQTNFAYELPQNSTAANGYTAQQQVIQTPTAQQHSELGTGQLFMSAWDLYCTDAAMLNGTLLNNASAAKLFVSGSPSHYGAGFYQNGDLLRANGFGYGFQAFTRISRNGANAVIILCNRLPKAGSDLRRVADQLAQQTFLQI